MLKRNVFTILLTVALFLSIMTAANAYYAKYYWDDGTINDLKYKWDSKIINYPDWKNAFTSAYTDWNATPTKADFSYSSTSNCTLGIIDVVNGAPGYCSIGLDSYNRIYGFYASGNINSTATGTFTSTMKRSTAGHELGHALGQGDEPFAIYVPLMDPNRNRSTIYVPKQDDINGVNYMYP